MQLKYDCTNFLKNSKFLWVQYNLETDSNGLSSRAKDLKYKLLQDSSIKNLLYDSIQWPKIVLKRHNDANHILNKICLLIDFGLTIDDAPMLEIANKILSHQSEEGAFLSTLNISKSYGGSGEDSLEWLVCDFPILLFILLKLGFENDNRVMKAIDCLINISSDNGWRCVGSLPKFRGPGRKDDFCPYGTLVSLKAFSLLPKYHESDFVLTGIDAILNFWKHQKEQKIYMFGIGTDFRKLKYPNIWFDIVHVLRILSHYEYAKTSNEFREMASIIIDKQQTNGGFIPESIYMAWKGWDFGQKKVVSDSLTYQINKFL